MDAQPIKTDVAVSSEEQRNGNTQVAERYPFVRLKDKKSYIIKGNNFELPNRYTVTARLGQGSYGMVVQAIDSETGEKVAIKKCASVFKYPEDGKRILREIKLMQMMNHRNILTIMDVLPPSGRNFEDVYIVMTCADTDLSNIIRSQTLSEGHCKYIIYQIYRGLKYIHSANVLHRDLKPANILINFDCRIKICDFGLARGADPSKKQNLTNYVVTRWYRAPELLLDNTRYSGAIDVWAAGCIFGELLRGSALFPGESSLDQMHKVADGVGIPEDDDLWWIQSSKARDYLKSRCEKENRVPNPELKQLLPHDIKQLAYDFIIHQLSFNPYKRWSADWLLDHPYLAEYHRPDSCIRATEHFKWQWDSVCPDPHTLRQLFWQEMVRFHPEIENSTPSSSTAAASALTTSSSPPAIPTTTAVTTTTTTSAVPPPATIAPGVFNNSTNALARSNSMTTGTGKPSMSGMDAAPKVALGASSLINKSQPRGPLEERRELHNKPGQGSVGTGKELFTATLPERNPRPVL